MATAPNEFVAHCLELLGSVGSARSRRMFGGHGFYVDDLFIAKIDPAVAVPSVTHSLLLKFWNKGRVQTPCSAIS